MSVIVFVEVLMNCLKFNFHSGLTKKADTWKFQTIKIQYCVVGLNFKASQNEIK
jgi:hypothetical protein